MLGVFIGGVLYNLSVNQYLILQMAITAEYFLKNNIYNYFCFIKHY